MRRYGSGAKIDCVKVGHYLKTRLNDALNSVRVNNPLDILGIRERVRRCKFSLSSSSRRRLARMQPSLCTFTQRSSGSIAISTHPTCREIALTARPDLRWDTCVCAREQAFLLQLGALFLIQIKTLNVVFNSFLRWWPMRWAWAESWATLYEFLIMRELDFVVFGYTVPLNVSQQNFSSCSPELSWSLLVIPSSSTFLSLVKCNNYIALANEAVIHFYLILPLKKNQILTCIIETIEH